MFAKTDLNREAFFLCFGTFGILNEKINFKFIIYTHTPKKKKKGKMIGV